MTSHISVAFAGLVALPAGLAAQDVPAPLLTLEVAGPEGLRRAFLATNLGNLIGADEGKAVWAGLFEQLSGAWHRSKDTGEADSLASFREQVKGYDGRLRLRVFDVVHAASAAGKPQEYRQHAVVDWSADGHTDLRRLADGMGRLLRNEIGGPPRPVRVGTTTVDVWDRVSMPQVQGDRVVAFLGDDMDATVPVGLRALAQAERAQPERAPERAQSKPPQTRGAAPVRLDVDLRQVVAMARRRARSRSVFDTEATLLGYAALDRLTATCRPVGPHVRVDVDVRFGKGSRGLFDGLFPRGMKPPGERLLPDGAPVWSSFGFDFPKIWDTILAAVDAWSGDRPGQKKPSARQQVNKFAGFDVREMLTTLGPEVLVLGNPLVLFDLGGGAIVAIQARDPKKLEGALYGVMGRTSEVAETYQGVTINEAADTMSAASGDRLLLAWGDKGLERMHRVIDRIRSTTDAARTKATAEPPRLQRVRRHAPPGCNSMGVIDAHALRSSLIGGLIQELLSYARRWTGRGIADGTIQQTLAKMSPALKKYELDKLSWFTGADADGVHARFIW